jgi:protein SCO1/2
MNKHRIQALTALTALGLVVAACGGSDDPTGATVTIGSVAQAQTPAPTAAPNLAPNEPAAASSLGDPVPAPELAGLVQPDGAAFELASLAGEPVLVFFGYTHCPDVCPTTMGELFGVFEEEPQAQAVFVSVDPERDTPEFLAEWTKYLPENLHAVTGSPGAVRRAADNYGVKYARVETTSTAGYTMSHTAALYLIDAEGQLLLEYPYGTSSAAIVEDLRSLEAG